jgi:dihydropteroate synthase
VVTHARQRVNTVGRAPLLMGVLNTTPDSFFDGGAYTDPHRAIEHGLQLLEEGADWLDVGGESTRPGAAAVPAEEELHRVIPVLEGIARQRPSAVLSVDTSKALVAERAIAAGATVINDVSALSDERMASLAARHGVTLVIMHMRGQPATMQQDTHYDDLVGEVAAYLAERAQRALRAGVPRERVVLDPGLGFGKRPEDNPRLIAAVPTFRALGFPVLVGASRKAFIGRLTGVQRAQDRLHGSVGAALAAARHGADILRVHDVRPTREALQVFLACGGGG